MVAVEEGWAEAAEKCWAGVAEEGWTEAAGVGGWGWGGRWGVGFWGADEEGGSWEVEQAGAGQSQAHAITRQWTCRKGGSSCAHRVDWDGHHAGGAGICITRRWAGRLG